jgi:RNA polymerase sigma-70 factor (ECF subfamily)
VPNPSDTDHGGRKPDAPAHLWASAALDVLMRRHHALVYGYCRRMLGDDVDAMDVSQTVFLQVLEAIRNGVVIENERAWLLGISRNRCLDRLRRRSFVLADEDELERILEQGKESGPVMLDPLTSSLLDDVLDVLDRRSRVVLLLRYYDDLSYDAISELTGDTPGALRVRVNRALRLLRRLLQLKGVTA